MSSTTERNASFFKTLLCGGKQKKSRQKIIRQASTDNIDALSEIALNLLKGNIPLNTKEKKKLKRHKDKIRKLGKRNVSTKKKKTLLVQEGGFLPLLLAPFLSAAGYIAGRAISTALDI